MGSLLHLVAPPAGRKALVILAFGCAVTGLAGRSQAIVTFGPLRGELSVEFEGLQIKPDDGPAEREYLFEERFRVGTTGYVLHPGILTIAAEVAPSASQQIVRNGDLDEDNSNRFLDYLLSFGVLKSRPLNFDASATSSSGTTTAGFGNRREFRADTYRVAATVSNPYFPLGMHYTKRFLEQSETGSRSGVAFEADEEEDTLAVWGRNSKMDVSVSRSWFEDKEKGRNRTSDTGRLAHRLLRWGKGSSLGYNIDYLNREGFLSFRRLATSERLHLQHTDDLYTAYSHSYTQLDRDRETRSHFGDVTLHHQLRENLSSRVFVSGSSTDSDDEQARGYTGGLGLTYTKRLPGEGRLRLGTAGSYRTEKVRSKNGLSEVVGEPHTVNTTAIFFLNRRFVSAGTILVSNADRTIDYEQGRDYEVVTVDGLTQIVILLGGRINVGDALVLDYLFEALPSREIATTTYSYDTGLDYGWVSAYHRGAFLRQDLRSGRSGTPLVETDDFTTGVVFTFSGSATRATLTAEDRHTRYEDFRSDTISLRENLQHTFSPRVSVTLNASQTLFDSDGSDFVTFNERLLIHLRPARNLFLDLHGERWSREEDEGFQERFWEAGPELRWFVGRVEINSRYSHREWGGVFGDREEDRITFAFRRRF